MKMAFTTAALALALCVMSSTSNAQYYYGNPPTSHRVNHRPPPRYIAPPQYVPPRYVAPRHHRQQPPAAAIAIPLAILGVMAHQLHQRPRYDQRRIRQRVQSNRHESQWASGSWSESYKTERLRIELRRTPSTEDTTRHIYVTPATVGSVYKEF